MRIRSNEESVNIPIRETTCHLNLFTPLQESTRHICPASHKRAPTLDPTALKSLTRLCTHSALWTKVAHPMAAVCRLWRFSRTAVLANIQQEDLQRAAWLALTPPFLCFPYLAVHRILGKHSIPFEAKTSSKYAHAFTHCPVKILTK